MYMVAVGGCFFFFKQKTAYEMRISDWSSDVCSSDLLARSGADVAAVVSFHGGLATDDPLLAKHIKARVLAMNGADDRGTMPDAGKFMDEMRMSPADWQFVVLGHAVHCFTRSAEHTSELQSLMRIPYAVFCLKKK